MWLEEGVCACCKCNFLKSGERMSPGEKEETPSNLQTIQAEFQEPHLSPLCRFEFLKVHVP